MNRINRINRGIRLAGLLGYVLLFGLLMGYDWTRMVRPVPLLSVLAGMILLTACQWRRGLRFAHALPLMQWNAFVAGFLATLVSLLSLSTSGDSSFAMVGRLPEHIIPLIYGGMGYIIIGLLRWEYIPSAQPHPDPSQNGGSEDGAAEDHASSSHNPILPPDPLFRADVAYIILTRKGFTPRECHVALKLLENTPNKEIASQLFVTEATIKKHIQNMFKKCDCANRQGFLLLYKQWYDAYLRDGTDGDPRQS